MTYQTNSVFVVRAQRLLNGDGVFCSHSCEHSRLSRDFQSACVHKSTRKVLRSRSDSPGARRASTAACSLRHTGTALASNFFPRGVNSSRRARWSCWFGVILSSPRRLSGFSAAVKVVRSIASKDATAPIVGASGRFKDIINENCQLVRPSGRNALSNCRARARAARCTWRQRQESRTRIVVPYDVPRGLAISAYDSLFGRSIQLIPT
jgi:hypothetical protein